ncbi:MAG TPA: ATP-binding cassette domain-containing protein [Anaerolineae bacterium]|nr:ATP-binding cassette domain-containing protein [Anaerolineae bacterium]
MSMTMESSQTASVEPLLELRGIGKSFGALRALDDVNFVIYPGEVQALVGDNGAGKSTLVKIIAGAHRPDRGEIFFQGKPVQLTSPSAAFALGIATVYQDLALVGTRDVANNLFMGREPTRWGVLVDRRKMVQEAQEVIQMLNVDIPSVDALVSNLSGGQRQAIAIGRAVHEERSILVLDEPAAALGVKESHQILTLIEKLRDQGQAIVIVSHNLLHVFRVADRITVLRRGRLVGSRLKSKTTVDEIVKMITGADML